MRDNLFHIKPILGGVRSKFSKEFIVPLFPVGEYIHKIIYGWISYCKNYLLFNDKSPLIPASITKLNNDLFFNNGEFSPQARHFQTGNQINKALNIAFQNANLPAYTCHDIRRMIADYGQEICET